MKGSGPSVNQVATKMSSPRWIIFISLCHLCSNLLMNSPTKVVGDQFIIRHPPHPSCQFGWPQLWLCGSSALQRIINACNECEVFQVVDHSVDVPLVAAMTETSCAFFSLPAEDKLSRGSNSLRSNAGSLTRTLKRSRKASRGTDAGTVS
ncbi:Flavanone 3-dioxygenase [Nymphaea thermarum]|nr:Flavanone 3-dioxygenase [Nymphaea thermarum]